MTEKNNIEVFLNIEIGDRRLHNGKQNPNKNKYYYYNELYYIVELTQNKWMILSDCRETRVLLREHVWFYHSSGYAQTRIGKSKSFYHKLYLNYENGLVCDHMNRKRFDNRFDNLRIVTYKENSRNRTMQHNNTIGRAGVCERLCNNTPYIIARINDNNGNRLSKSFNVNRLGRDEALRLAIEQRAAWVREFGYMHN